MSKTTISVDERTLERFKDAKEELDQQQDAPNHSADSFMNALLDTWEAADSGYYDQEISDELAEVIRNELDSGNGNSNQISSGEIAKEVSRQFDYAELANQVASELEGRIR